MKSPGTFSRRTLLSGFAAGALATVAGAAKAQSTATSQGSAPALPVPPADQSAARLAQDEAFWRDVSTHYRRVEGIIDLEHGYWGKMAAPVEEAYLAATRRVNQDMAVYARGEYGADLRASIARVAAALGVAEDEIVLTRNATESLHSLVRQYQTITPADAVLYSDVDYPSYQDIMQWLADSNGATAVKVTLPPRAAQAQILAAYVSAFDANPALKLVLLTHVSNQHGLVVPVAQIAEQARARGIDVICDSAQSWGLLDFQLPSLNVDWACFNLHKWIGSPVGVGALYMRRGTLARVAPYPGDSDPDNTRVAARVHPATANFAAFMAVPAALDFHQAVGGANKEARLKYLRSLWTTEADAMPHIEVLGGADEASWTGMAGVRLRGQTTAQQINALQQRLQKDFGIFTVARYDLASGACIRVTPQVFTTPDEMAQLVSALRQLA